MRDLLSWLFGTQSFGRHPRSDVPVTPIRPAPQPQPVQTTPPPESESEGLQPLKSWSHPFKDKGNPLEQLTHMANAAAGYYPLGRNGLWHGGVHFDSGTAGTLDQSSVHCLADGEVVAYRIETRSPTTSYIVNKQSMEKPFSRNFVLVRHRLQPPQIQGSPDTPPSLIFYSLYMHLEDWANYEADPGLQRPAFWPERNLRVRDDVANSRPGTSVPRGLKTQTSPMEGGHLNYLDLLAPGTPVVVSGEGKYRKLEHTRGPAFLCNADGSLLGYVAFSDLEHVNGATYRVSSSLLPVRPAPSTANNKLHELRRGTEITISGDGEFRKLEHITQYVLAAGLQGERAVLSGGQVVVLDLPAPIKTGDLIGHLGLYQEASADQAEKKLHLEVFSGDDVDVFIEASRAWAKRLPDKDRTWLKLAKGTAVVAHQENATAARLRALSTDSPLSDADLLVPKRLLDGLPADKKIMVPASDSHKARNWYRLEGLLHDADNNLLDGWVCEEIGTTPWLSPWSWEGYAIIFDYGTPRHALASFLSNLRRFNEEQLERYRPLADKDDKGPIKSRLYDIIDRNRDGKMTPEELQAAIRLPAHAQSISQLIIRKESEWYHQPQKWDALDELLGHSGSTPHLNWLAEKQRIEQLSWWGDVAEKVGLPSWGKVFHFHPVGLLAAFTSKDKSKILAGKVTYNAEGNDNPGSIHYSRVIHWPGNELSGVTLGRGYDMGHRTRSEIYSDMTQTGIENAEAHKISLAHGLKGVAAEDFVRNNKALISEITISQQITLFNLIYPAYVVRAISVYKKWTDLEEDRVAWENLDPIIQDVLVDFVYQGFTAGPNPMRSGMRNSRHEMISYIQNTPAISQYEPGRRRANYLRDN